LRIVEPHRHQAMVNHRRTLEEIAERGGLDPIELVAVLENRPARWMGQIEAVDRLLELLRGRGRHDPPPLPLWWAGRGRREGASRRR
jgi:hypothetical protein